MINADESKQIKKRDAKLESKMISATEKSQSKSLEEVKYTEVTIDSQIPYQEYYCTPDGVLEQIQKAGTAVVADVLSEDELKFARQQLWLALEDITKTCSKPFKFEDKSTWRGFYDLLPKHGMLLQHWGVGQTQFCWDIRQNPKVANVFAKIWKCKIEDLLVSFDGISVALCPEVTKRAYFKGNMWCHVDQSYTKPNFMCVQGMVTLWDVNEGDATLCFHEGSNEGHKAFGDHFGNKDKADWQKISNDEQAAFMAKYPLRCVKASAGSLILWDSRTCHQGIEPRKERAGKETIRCVVYVCYLPRSLSNQNDLKKKIEAFENGRMTTHWPTPVKMFPKTPRLYGNPVPTVTYPPKPVLTDLGRKLVGYTDKQPTLFKK